MTCALCRQPVTLLDLDPAGWCGEPAHEACARTAMTAFDEACEQIAAQHRARHDRIGKRYDRAAEAEAAAVTASRRG